MRRLAAMLIGSIVVVAAPAAAQPAAPQAGLCDATPYHQFDFWVGRWDVYRADTDKLVAHSVIEKLYGGCAVRENWMPLQGTGGGSLNGYRPDLKQWRQVWMGSVNDFADYSGGLDGNQMILTGTSRDTAGTSTMVRMSFEPKSDGSVVQTGFQSADGGKNWQVRYVFTYRRPPS